MSFLSKRMNKKQPYERQYLLRKENDSSSAHHFIQISPSLLERTSAFTSRGSITVEAALSVSIFFFAALCLVMMLNMMMLKIEIRNAMHAVGKELAVEMYVNPIVPHSRIEKEIVERIGREKLTNSLILDGCEGLDCSRTKRYWNTTILDLQVDYKIEIPIFMFHIPVVDMKEIIRIKGWTGYESGIIGDLADELVYVTDHGVVYHRDKTCTHLDLSIQMISLEVLSEYRNQNGAIYKPCSICKDMQGQMTVYITTYGNRFHNSLECSGLKRNVYAVPLSEVYGLGGCSKCAG